MPMSLSVSLLNKSYGKQQVLKDLSFSLQSGEVVGFLGPNGAGKSTTMKIISTCLQPDSGQVLVDGVDALSQSMRAKTLLGYLPEHNPLYVDMYVKEYLLFVARLCGLGKDAKQRVDEMIEKTGLQPEYRKKIVQLSKGYRQRVGLAQAMMHNPKVLILDEPTTGLDPNQLLGIRQLITEFGQDRTVLLSTHIMGEVAALCSRFLVLRQGQLVADRPISDLQGADLEQVFHQLTL